MLCVVKSENLIKKEIKKNSLAWHHSKQVLLQQISEQKFVKQIKLILTLLMSHQNLIEKKRQYFTHNHKERLHRYSTYSKHWVAGTKYFEQCFEL